MYKMEKKIHFSFILLSNKYIIDAILLWYIKQKSFEQEGKASKKKKFKLIAETLNIHLAHWSTSFALI